MSHFYGTLNGSAGEATRCGTKESGLMAHAAGWGGAVQVRVEHVDGVDHFMVKQVQWRAAGCNEILARGVLGTPAGRFSALSSDERDALRSAVLAWQSQHGATTIAETSAKGEMLSALYSELRVADQE